MRKSIFLLVACLLTAAVAMPYVAFAKAVDHVNFGYCKSGKKVKDVHNCKENGGSK